MAKLSTKQRKNLSKSSFVFPAKAPGSGSYPIPDKAHGRNALTRVVQHGTPSQKATVKATVKKKFPGIGKEPARGAAATIARMQKRFA
jgi:hypothetical protein